MSFQRFVYVATVTLIGTVVFFLFALTLFAMTHPGTPASQLRLSDILGFGAIFISPLMFVAFLARPRG